MTNATPDLAQWVEWLTLAAIPQVGPRRLWQLVAALGSPGAVLRAKGSVLRAVEGVDQVTADSIVEHRDSLDLRGEAEALHVLGGRLVTFLDDEYPRALRRLDEPPPILHVLGELRALDEVAVAVIGSRNITDYGRQMAEMLAGGLAEAGVTVVSGFATGVDGVAHAAAMDRGGRTLAVLGCGLDVVYPSTHRRLRQRVIEHGALVTTYPLGTAPRKEHFPERNALLAGLALGVVVVEAGEKSGALITAERACEQGKPVFAVPGDVTRTNSRGVNRLIQDGSKLVMSADDVLADLQGALRALMAELGGAALGPLGGDAAPVPAELFAGLSDEERALFAEVQAGPVQIDALQRGRSPEARASLPMHLMNLQLHGLIEELPGKRFAARPSVAALAMPPRPNDTHFPPSET